jgi:chemotaxis protein CheD
LADPAYDREVLYVEPGHLVVSTEPCRLRTVLGSCVSVCLYDAERRHGGMNHFMLPESPSRFETSSRYGSRAMPLLVERLERLGSARRQLCASVYGGACVLFTGSDLMHLGRRNVEFALQWLEQNGINVVASSVLGNAARRVDFDVETGTSAARSLADARCIANRTRQA